MTVSPSFTSLCHHSTSFPMWLLPPFIQWYGSPSMIERSMLCLKKKKPLWSRCTVQHVYLSSSRIKKKYNVFWVSFIMLRGIDIVWKMQRNTFFVSNKKVKCVQSCLEKEEQSKGLFFYQPTSCKKTAETRAHTRESNQRISFLRNQKGKKKNGIDPVSPISLMGIDYKVSQSQANVKKK